MPDYRIYEIGQDGHVVRLLIELKLATPHDATHWSIRSMAKQTGLSHTTIRRIWTAFGLQPHRSETFKLSTDPLFVDKVRDIVGLYLSPPDRALVLASTKKTKSKRPIATAGLADDAGHAGAMYSQLRSPRHHVAVRRPRHRLRLRHRKVRQAPPGERVPRLPEGDRRSPSGRPRRPCRHGQLRHHKTPRIRAWLARRPRYHVHFTPTSASWINQVERWFAELTRKQIQRGVHTSVRQLEADIGAFIEAHNTDPKPTDGPNPPTRSSPPSSDFATRQTPHYAANFRFR